MEQKISMDTTSPNLPTLSFVERKSYPKQFALGELLLVFNFLMMWNMLSYYSSAGAWTYMANLIHIFYKSSHIFFNVPNFPMVQS